MTQRAFNIEVNLDASQAERQLNDFEREVQNTQRELQGLGGNTRNLDSFGQRARGAASDVGALDSSLSDIDGSIGNMSASLGAAGQQANSFTEGITGGLQTLFTFQTAMNGTNALLQENEREYQRVNAAMDALDNQRERGTISQARYVTELERLGNEMNTLDGELASLRGRMDGFRSATTAITRVLGNARVQIALAGAAAVIAAGQMAKLTTQMATLAQVDTTTLQQFSIATNKFGVTTEQAANILKDFNDKVGDFIVTGGGPFVDVMERLGESSGLTAEKIASLSGPEGLVTLVNAMEKAGLSTQETTFFLESLGSDLTLLLPLLKNNGAALNDITSDFDSLGQVVAGSTLESLTSLSNEFQDTVGIIKTAFLELAGAVAPVIEGLLTLMNKLLTGFVVGTKLIVSSVQKGVALISQFAGLLASGLGMDDIGASLTQIGQDLAKDSDDLFKSALNLNKATDKTKENLEALNKLQNERATKESGTLEKQIANQQSLLIAIGKGTEAYEAQKRTIANLAAQEKLRKDLEKKGLRKEQIDALVAQLGVLQDAEYNVTQALEAQVEAESKNNEVKQTSIDLTTEQAEADNERQLSISGVITGLQNELRVLQATTDAERERIKAQQELNKLIDELDLTSDQEELIAMLQAQIIKQNQLNDATAEGLRIQEQAKATEKSRKEGIANFNQSLQDELELLQAKTDAQREQIAFQQKLRDLEANSFESGYLQTVYNQIAAQEEHNRVLKAQQEEYGTLGAAVTAWALDSEDAILKVVASLIQLIALQAGFDQNPFVTGFIGGLKGFAKGGTFGAGETFMVGEEGPEIITSQASGTVIPNDDIANRVSGVTSSSSSFAQNISLSINGSIVASEELDRKFEEFAGAVADNTQSLLRNQLRSGGVLA